MNKKAYYIAIILLTIYLIFSYFLIVHAEEYSAQQLEIAKVISAEACGEGKLGMYLVTNTIRNRAIKYNKTPYEIITQKNQYYGQNHPNKEKLYNQCEDFSNNLAKNVMIYPDLTNNALYFKTEKEQRQKWHNIKTLTFKNHEFWK